MTTVTISLPDSLKDFVEGQVRTKGYGNVSEYFRGLLRQAQERAADERLEKLLLDGLGAGEDIEVDRKFWKDLKAEARDMVEKRKKKRA